MADTFFGKSAFLLVLAILFSPAVSMAAGWEDTFGALSSGKAIQEGVTQSDQIYSANYSFVISDGDGVLGNFSSTDSVSYSVSNVYTGDALSFSGTKEELTAWAEANADKLYSILFLGAPDTSIAGEPNSTPITAQGIERIFSALQDRTLRGSDGSFQNIRNNDIRVSAQYDFFEVGKQNIDSSGTSGVFSYARVVGETGRHAVGIEIPYRSLEADDQTDSTMLFVMLSPFYEYSTTSGPNRYVFTAGLNFGATYLESDIFDDGGGYFQYGGMIGGGVARILTERLEGRVALSLQYLDRFIPESQVSDEYQWIASALNDVAAETLLTPALGLTYWITPNKLSVEGNLFRIHSLGSDVDEKFKYQTVVNAFINYMAGNWLLTLGYKTSFELEDFTDRSVIAAVRYLW